ncbi:MAG TPA: type II toxin-antitoxin system PemK/MazF family toxin [Methanothrix sp.]|nr:type II toxin-antitoxin system PemK/MazF family toxin [Methanothrix sp.]
MKGDIVLVPFPNSDLTTWKRRPALVIYEDPVENETTIAYISTRTPIIPSICDVLVTRGTPSFDETGLKYNSVIKLNKLATIKTHFIAGLLGTADDALLSEVNKTLDACLKFALQK